MAKKPGILFMVPSLTRAGAEMQAVSLANGIDALGYRKHLLSYRANLAQLSRIAQGDVQFFHVPRKSRLDPFLVKTVAQVIDEKSIDLVHCTMQHAFLIAWLATFFSKRKPRLVTAIHTTVNKSIRGDLFDRWLYSIILRSCDRIIFVCVNQKKHWIERYPFLSPKSTIVYNGVDPEHFDPAKFVDQGRQLRKRYGIPEKAPVISCIAAFRPEKAHDILIQAFSKLNAGAFLLLLGEGPKKMAVEAMVKQKNLARRVIFLGMVSDVRPVLAASDISVLSSTSVETFSMAMLESMSMQVPMVATDMGGIGEAIVPGKTGFLVRPGDPFALAQGMRTLLESCQQLELLGKNCRASIIAKFSEAAMIEETHKIIGSLVGFPNRYPCA